MLRVSQLSRTMTARTALRVLSLDNEQIVTHNTIKKAYVKQTLLCHPDLHPNDPEASHKFRTLAEALRTALTSLRLSKSTSTVAHTTADTQDTLDALRRAVVRYQQHQRESSFNPQYIDNATEAGGCVSDLPNSSHRSSTVDDISSAAPSLEYVSSVCRREAIALRRVELFCEQLPSVLCGSASPPLFEAVAFFPHYFVESTADCVVRFSRNVPLIVRRVVHNRGRRIRYAYSKANQGIATSNRSSGKDQIQRIEDMLFKPLVLMGALVFTTPPDRTMAGEVSTDNVYAEKMHKSYLNDARKGWASGDESREKQYLHSNMPGVTATEHIRVVSELTCVVHSTDSVKEIVDKIGRWEADSFARLKLELAIVDVADLVANMLGLTYRKRALALPTNLELNSSRVKNHLTMMQKIAGQMCYFYESSRSCGDEEEKSSAHEPRWSELTMPSLMWRCRQVASLVQHAIRGSILLTPPFDMDSTEPPPDDCVLLHPHMYDSEAEILKITAAPVNDSDLEHFGVNRHFSCSTAEDIGFAVSIRLTCNARLLLLRLLKALYAVRVALERTQRCLADVVFTRDAVKKEEFIIAPTEDAGCACEVTPTRALTNFSVDMSSEHANSMKLNNTVADNDEVNFSSFCSTHDSSSGLGQDCRRYIYRAAIHSFVRVYNMSTENELLFWRQLHRHRTIAAGYGDKVHPINLYYNKITHPSSNPVDGKADTVKREGEATSRSTEGASGWIEQNEDGYDCIVIGDTELNDELAFRAWLEEILRQSEINKQAQDTLRAAGVGYVTRDPELPLTYFLSFVKVFVNALAVRSVIERRALATTRPAPLTSSEEIGLHIIVSTYCDLCEGGKLYIAWHTDPTLLIALLTEEHENTQLHTSQTEQPLLIDVSQT